MQEMGVKVRMQGTDVERGTGDGCRSASAGNGHGREGVGIVQQEAAVRMRVQGTDGGLRVQGLKFSDDFYAVLGQVVAAISHGMGLLSVLFRG